jgi:acetolactate synthase-1/2/3 large subunit
MHQEREYPGRVSGSDLYNPDFAALARAYGWQAETVQSTAAFEPALRKAIEAGVPTLFHLKLDADVSTTRTTLSAIRKAAQAKATGA